MRIESGRRAGTRLVSLLRAGTAKLGCLTLYLADQAALHLALQLPCT